MPQAWKDDDRSKDLAARDEWSDWLLNLRHGGDATLAAIVQEDVRKEADRVIDGARLDADSRLLDVGSGDGLVGFRAIERLGSGLNVVFADISVPMLTYVEAAARERGVTAQCRFVRASAETLAEFSEASFDAVITRASLAYVPNKAAALGEFFRVLKPGGRLSCAEPVLQDEAFVAMALRTVLESKPLDKRDPYMTWRHRVLAAQFPDTHEGVATNPLTNVSERDVLRMVKVSGFRDIHMEVHFDIEPSKITSWETFIGMSPHPWAPSLKAVLESRFTSDERVGFENIARPAVERGEAQAIGRSLYLTARKPASKS